MKRQVDKRVASRVTLDDVAEKAGVSAITVSRALRNPGMVSEKLRRRIEGAVLKLGYVPNMAASRLASARSHAIGVIVPTLYNVIFAEYLQALHEVFLPEGFQVIVVNSRYSQEEEESAVRILLGQHVEAMIIVGVNHTPLARRLLMRSRIPVIETFQIAPEPIGLNIALDQVQAGYDATRFLLDKGYERVGFLLGQRDERALERLQGFSRAMAERGLDGEQLAMSLPSPSTIALGAELMASLHARRRVPDALFCIDDNLALGALQECRRLGLKVPDDVAILGFHDLEFSACSSPSLSSVATHRHELGALAAKCALEMIGSSVRRRRESLNLGYEIKARESTSEAAVLRRRQ
ncbi:LacI family DNA-binding transcriptional regulator [Aestuariivirga sp.]|uniref:LacI family DNA-binding transcriptional regulator n=1 Tax=Aestuariivirga sp. TaxID=2650926 RepID=UPI003BA97AA6